jgi:hypothetical protein
MVTTILPFSGPNLEAKSSLLTTIDIFLKLVSILVNDSLV